MEYNYKLTIAVITMNRAKQLECALASCLNSNLPEKTQFVIVNNGSTDETDTIVNGFINKCPYSTNYKKEIINLGAGGGRNVCFDMSEGEYVYFLDDDAEIAEECREEFFVKAIDYMDHNSSVATLTTNIVDNVFGDRTGSLSKHERIDGLRTVYRFHEGSVFIRSSYFSHPLYVDIVYGAEGIPISVKAIDDGYHNVYEPSIYIIHKPEINKWEEQKDYMNLLGASNMYVLKKLQYPILFSPVLYLVYKIRISRYDIQEKSLIKEFAKRNRAFLHAHKIKKVKCSTILKMFREYGSTIF